MNLETITVSDLLENYYRRDQAAVLSNGKVVGFVHEQAPPSVAFLCGTERRINERRQARL